MPRAIQVTLGKKAHCSSGCGKKFKRCYEGAMFFA